MNVYFSAKFQVSSVTLTSFRQGITLHPPLPKRTPKYSTQIRVKDNLPLHQLTSFFIVSLFITFQRNLQLIRNGTILQSLTSLVAKGDLTLFINTLTIFQELLIRSYFLIGILFTLILYIFFVFHSSKHTPLQILEFFLV